MSINLKYYRGYNLYSLLEKIKKGVKNKEEIYV